jgi:hypothetical protein
MRALGTAKSAGATFVLIASLKARSDTDEANAEPAPFMSPPGLVTHAADGKALTNAA